MTNIAGVFYMIFAFCLLSAILADNPKHWYHEGAVLYSLSVVAFVGFIITL